MSKEEVIEELLQFKSKCDLLIEHPNIVAFPIAYGTEDITCITDQLGDILTKHTFHSIPCLFDQIHNNKKFPEYHNVYMRSEKSNFAMISDGETFRYKPKKTFIDQIIKDKRAILNAYVNDNRGQLETKVIEDYERYHSSIDDDPSFRKDVEMEIIASLLDMKLVVLDDQKHRNL
jgi:hypothetical protein